VVEAAASADHLDHELARQALVMRQVCKRIANASFLNCSGRASNVWNAPKCGNSERGTNVLLTQTGHATWLDLVSDKFTWPQVAKARSRAMSDQPDVVLRDVCLTPRYRTCGERAQRAR
jgi:hypothetical protein